MQRHDTGRNSTSRLRALRRALKPLYCTTRDLICSLRGVQVGQDLFRLPLGQVVRIDEFWMREAIARLLPETEGIFLDVGVNLGQTLLSLRSVDRRRRYVGFEPNVECVSIVRRIVKENGFLESTVIPAACSGDFGIARLFHYTDSAYDSAASMVPNFRDAASQRGESVIVSASVVPCLAALGVAQVGLVKIDVEGFEADVLEALEPVLSRDRPPVLIEVLPIRDSSQRREATGRIMDLLGRIDFAPLQILKDSNGVLIGFRNCNTIGDQEEIALSDYLLYPKEKGSIEFRSEASALGNQQE